MERLLCGVISAVKYLHGQQILHNDIKSDNIVINKQDADVRSVLIDLGKACYITEAKKYSLSNEEKKSIYLIIHRLQPECESFMTIQD